MYMYSIIQIKPTSTFFVVSFMGSATGVIFMLLLEYEKESAHHRASGYRRSPGTAILSASCDDQSVQLRSRR